MFSSVTVLLTAIVDYAGLFPPAKLAMGRAIANYTQYYQTPYNWMLGNFVVPFSRLPEIETFIINSASENTLVTPWSLSVILSENWELELKQIQAFNHKNKLRIASLEFKPLPPEEIKRAIPHLPKEMESFFEIPFNENVERYLAVLEGTKASAKIRTGGLTADVFPNSDRLYQFILASANAKVPFKATAGLHHPLPGKYPVSYESNSLFATMQGFLNLSILTALVYWQKLTQEEALTVLQESSITSFKFQEDKISWQHCHLNLTELRIARQDFFRSFGSCSFQEPLDELKELQLL